MARHSERELTKAEWIIALGERIDQWSRISAAQQWLERQMLYLSDELPDDRIFGPDEMVDFIYRQARRERLQSRPQITFLEYLTEYGSVAAEARTFANDLVEICRHIGGDRLADRVGVLVHADHAAIWRYVLDFMAEVFTPLYPLIQQALYNERRVIFRLDDVEIAATPLSMGRAWLSICRESVARNGRQKTVIVLRGGSFEPDGSGLGLTGASGASLVEILSMLDKATQAFSLLDADERRQLFAAYLPDKSPELV